MTMSRSSSVKFFSMFVVLLMWFISLSLFVIGLNYAFASSDEVAYDVPAPMVGFLFALPFIRQVQPDVPNIGIIIDVMGFFFNMILIALSTVMVMAALTTRYYRVAKAKMRAQEKRFEKASVDVPKIQVQPRSSRENNDAERRSQALKDEGHVVGQV